MKCPACGYSDSKVIDSRPSNDGLSIRRRRECLECQRRFTTFETIETVQVFVIKKNGEKEIFDRTKKQNGQTHPDTVDRAYRASCQPSVNKFAILHRAVYNFSAPTKKRKGKKRKYS